MPKYCIQRKLFDGIRTYRKFYTGQDVTDSARWRHLWVDDPASPFISTFDSVTACRLREIFNNMTVVSEGVVYLVAEYEDVKLIDKAVLELSDL